MIARVLILFILLILQLPNRPASAHILDLRTGDYVSLSALLDDLESVQIVFVGERHDATAHHAAQRQIISELIMRGRKVAIALEMFRADGQAALDDWSNGRLDERTFKRIYATHWSMWPIYRPIFDLARQRKIPLVGLNIDRALPHQVSVKGFDSLTPEQLEPLSGVSCDVDQRYQDYLRKTLGGHPAGSDTFRFFCEAQLVWDAMMAQHLRAWQQRHPDTLVVVLAGSGHSWKYGIPEQLQRRAELSYRVLLPEILGRIDRSNTTSAEADYLLLGLEQGELH
jgi:uncharacterized iron-regulated protein